MNGQNTLLIGDEIAIGIDPWLRQIPGTLPILLQAMPASRISDWSQLPLFSDAIDENNAKLAKLGQSPIPWNLVVVSLGRREILDPDPKADLGSEVADVLKTIRDKLPNARIVWMLPPAIRGEGNARARIIAALSQAGVRVENMGRFTQVSDDSADMSHPDVADIPKEKYQKMAALLNNWIPLGQLQMKALPQPDGASSYMPGSVTSTFAEATSTPARKWGLMALGALVVLGGGYYIATERKNG